MELTEDMKSLKKAKEILDANAELVEQLEAEKDMLKKDRTTTLRTIIDLFADAGLPEKKTRRMIEHYVGTTREEVINTTYAGPFVKRIEENYRRTFRE